MRKKCRRVLWRLRAMAFRERTPGASSGQSMQVGAQARVAAGVGTVVWGRAPRPSKPCASTAARHRAAVTTLENLETKSRNSTLVGMARNFKDLTEREILALAVSLEEEDGRVYADFADGLRETYPATAKLFDDMGAEESEHRASLIATYRQRFGEHIPLIRRQDVKGFLQRRPFWLSRPLKISDVRKQAELMELETRQFYQKAIGQVTDAGIRKLLGDLEEIERKHQVAAEAMSESITPTVKKTEEEAQRRLFVLQIVQPGLAGLMDGSVSTLAPVFAAAFATRNSHDAFLVGLAASIGAGISMAFAEALSDDGSLTGRGRPVLRGAVTGLMTAAGGIGHTLPFLLTNFHAAFVAAVIIVAMELATIAWIRNRYMDTPLLSAAFQVVVGGVLVFAVGIWIGSS
ncbi:MAG TPA: ferritin family protein [Terriglobales bacterium]|nr:ferritin family protein [Terriglobales bacterium]